MSTEAELTKTEAEPVDVTAFLRELEDCHGQFPESALRQCQQHRELVIPHLIRAIEEAVKVVRAGELPTTDTHWIGVYLLWEFEAKEALPAILEGLLLPGEGPFHLFGDGITEDFGCILATLAGDRLDVVDSLISNPEANEYVRAAALSVYPLLVRDGAMSREEAVGRLREHLRRAVDTQQQAGTDWIICELCALYPQEARAEIEEAFERDLVEKMTIDRTHVEDVLARGPEEMALALGNLNPTRLEDTVEYLRDLPHFDEDDYNESDSGFENSPELEARWSAARREVLNSYVDEPEPGLPASSSTIRNEGPRIGRNDPCPCGSGKKYKKCCLRGDQELEIPSLF